MAKKLLNNNVNDFWKEVRAYNTCKTSTVYQAVLKDSLITELWRQHYTALSNCVQSEELEMEKGEYDANVGLAGIKCLKPFRSSGITNDVALTKLQLRTLNMPAQGLFLSSLSVSLVDHCYGVMSSTDRAVYCMIR